MNVVIEVENLRKTYGEIKAVNNISFKVAQGEIFGMLGPNGAGKTTTMEIVEGLRIADSGRVFVLGMDVKRRQRKIKAAIGVQLQTTSLYPRLKVHEVIDLFGSFFLKALPPDELIELVKLEDSRNKLCMNLSGGQQQRLSVALALVNDPQILFFDEPTSGLDPQARHNIWDVIKFAQEKGKTIFLTTHYMEEAERLCERVAIIDHGEIIAMGRPDKLIDQYFHEEAIEFQLDQSIGEDALHQLAGATNVVEENGKVTVYSGSVPLTISALMEMAKQKDMKLTELYVRRATLEDVFLKLTGRRIRD
ncbi:MAG TPA: ABC transporter ATP-binding protein [Dehalococcoidia bacterium]|nr:ABC transporter ATP-binding protein [Dehalococcoidia bacterium]